MPASYHRPKVARCVQHVMDKGHDKGSAIPICQASIGESYRIPKAERQMKRKGGKPLKSLRKEQAKVKAEKIQARREKMGWNEQSEAQFMLRLLTALNKTAEEPKSSVSRLIETLNANPQGCNQYGCKGGSSSGEFDSLVGQLEKAGHKTDADNLRSSWRKFGKSQDKRMLESTLATARMIVKAKLTKNGFCPTGKGGGYDNSCHGAGGKLNSKADERRRKLRRLWERAKLALKGQRFGHGEPATVTMGAGVPRNLRVNELLAILNGVKL